MEQKIDQIFNMLETIVKDVGVLKEDMKDVKESITRIETSQNEDMLTLVRSTHNKVEKLIERQEETDRVIDILSARTTRHEAKLNPQ